MADVLRTSKLYDLQRLTEEAELARAVLDFAKGPYGNGISLPVTDRIDPAFREHRNNNPFSGALDKCPYFGDIFENFRAPKSAFRLLRRGPKAAYAFHDDIDKGLSVARFQIPFVTSEQAFLLIETGKLDIKNFDFAGDQFKGDASGDVWFNQQQLHRACNGAVEMFHLEAGYLHYFDTNQVHTLINAADTERITLSIDVIVNDWMKNWMRENLTQKVKPSPMGSSPDVTWKWNALRHGIIRNA